MLILVYHLLIQNNHIFMLFMFRGKLSIDFLKRYPFISQKLNFTFY